MDTTPTPHMRRIDNVPAGWAVSSGLIDYGAAVTAMEARVEAVHDGSARELIWLLEHPPLYTSGVSAKPHDLLNPQRFPVHQSARGGQYTYHGPGQRVIYAMLDLRARRRDVRRYVQTLEAAIIDALASFGVAAATRCDRIGVWVERGGGREDKIAAIGVRVRRWVAFHGAAVNIAPDLSHFAGITPCGITDQRYGVTSLADLGLDVGLSQFDAVLSSAVAARFGPLHAEPAPDTIPPPAYSAGRSSANVIKT